MSLSIARECGATSYPKFGADHLFYEFSPEQLAAYEARIRADQRERDAELRRAAKAVAFSNGFDAAYPDKLDALRAAIRSTEGTKT